MRELVQGLMMLHCRLPFETPDCCGICLESKGGIGAPTRPMRHVPLRALHGIAALASQFYPPLVFARKSSSAVHLLEMVSLYFPV